jgi:hypothetical protein
LLQGGGLGLLLEEEAGGLNAVTSSGGLRLGVLGLLDNGLELSTEGSSLGVTRMVTTRGREPAADEQCHG